MGSYDTLKKGLGEYIKIGTQHNGEWGVSCPGALRRCNFYVINQ
jgi:hypothetical protein